MSDPNFEYRTENLRLMDSLFFLTSENGLAVMRFEQTFDHHWLVVYFDRSRWVEPPPAKTKFEELMDMDDLIRQCSISSKPYPTFHDMVMGEIKRLKERLP